jgi:hypothetical protein
MSCLLELITFVLVCGHVAGSIGKFNVAALNNYMDADAIVTTRARFDAPNGETAWLGYDPTTRMWAGDKIKQDL